MSRTAQQGDYDGTCALYAIIHAVTHIAPTIFRSDESRHALYQRIVTRLSPDMCKDLLLAGTYVRQMRKMLNHTKAVLEEDYDLILIWQPFSVQTDVKDDVDDEEDEGELRPDVFADISETVKDFKKHKKRIAFVIGVEWRGGHDGGHWTCVYNATKKQLRVKDGKMKIINAAHHGDEGRYVITDKESFLLALWEEKDQKEAERQIR